ncbi:hypothetical protein KAU11_04460, partial [Candidatus Babeliales bacterium]|nr:hypothetical protein [Candidatus Babeliales bacterium]
MKLFTISDEYNAIITTLKDGYECKGIIGSIDGIDVCIIEIIQAEKEFICTSAEDYIMVNSYISLLINKC